MTEDLIYRSYRQGGVRYEGVSNENAPKLKLEFTDNLYLAATPLWEQLKPGTKFAPIDVKDIFGNDKPLNVEIGIGNGEFISHYAALHTGENWLGFEVFHKVFEKAVSRAKKLHTSNVRLIQFDAELFVRLLRDNSVKAFYVNFPDPWPKAKHTKRRLLKTWFIELMSTKLMSGGTLTIATDHDDYAAEIKENLPPVVSLESTLGTLCSGDMGDYYKTKYYRKFAAQNNLYFFRLKKVK